MNKQGLFLFALIHVMSICGIVYSADPFPEPSIKAPKLAKPDVTKSLYNVFKNEQVNLASHRLSIVNQDLSLPGLGKLNFTLTRSYSAKKWDTRKSDSVVDAYVDEVWADINYYPNLYFSVKIGLDIETGGLVINELIAQFSSLQGDEDRKADFKRSVQIRQEMGSQHEFQAFGEAMLGRNWDLFFSGFNRIYIIDRYSEKHNNLYGQLPTAHYLDATWQHLLYLPTASGGDLSFYRSEYKPLYKIDLSHPPMNKVGEYQNGSLGSDNKVHSIIDKQFKMSFDGLKYVLRTLGGVTYVFTHIQDVAAFSKSEVGVLDYAYYKRVAFLSEIIDIYGNRIVLNYSDPASGKVDSVTLSTSETGNERVVDIQYQAGKAIAAVWKAGSTELKKVQYEYQNGRLGKSIDPQGRTVQYSYHGAGPWQDRINKVTYHNQSYTEYLYGEAQVAGDSLASSAAVALKDMIFPKETGVRQRIRVDVNPGTGATRKAIKTLFSREISIKGRIQGNDGATRTKASDFEVTGNLAYQFQAIDAITYRKLEYHYDNKQRLTESYTPLREQGGYTLYQVQRMSYGSDPYRGAPDKVESLVKLDTSEVKLQTKLFRYDGYDQVAEQQLILSNQTSYNTRTTNTYKLITRSAQGYDHLVYVPEHVILYEAGGKRLQQSRAEYDQYGQVKKLFQHHPDGSSGLVEKEVSRFTYRGDNPWLLDVAYSRFDQREIHTRFGYTGSGARRMFPTTVTKQGGSIQIIVSAEYDQRGRLTRVTDENGNVTRVTAYDAVDRIRNLLLPAGIAAEYVYNDAANHVQTRTLTNGSLVNTEHRLFDGYGRPLHTYSTDASGSKLGPETTWTLDERGLVKYQTIKGGGLERTTLFKYDAGGRPVEKHFADGSKIVLRYDGYAFGGGANSGLTWSETVNQLGQTARVYQDFLGRTVRSEVFKGSSKHVTETVHNTLGKPVMSVFNPGPNAKTSYFEYDNLGRLTRAWYNYDGASIDRGVPSVHNSYNTGGSITSKVLRDGTRSEYKYDAMGRIEKLEFPGHAEDNITYSYGTASPNINKIKSVATAACTTQYSYGIADRRLAFTNTIHAGGLNRAYGVLYTYDGLGRRESISIPGKLGQRSFHYRYDALSRLSELRDNLKQLASCSYDGLSQPTEVTILNKFTTANSFDRMGRVTGIKTTDNGKDVFKEQYAYDVVGNRTSTRLQNGSLETYGYSPALSMLTKVTYPKSGRNTMSYSYDGRLNRTSWQHLHGSFDYEYDQTGKLTRYFIDKDKTKGRVHMDFSYDGRGNTTGMQLVRHGSVVSTNHYGFNRHNQLTSFTRTVKGRNGQPDAILQASYAYDHAGLRVMQQVGTNRTYYLYEAASQRLLAEFDGTGTATRVYIPGLGHIDEADGGKEYFEHKDVLGTARVVVDSDGKVVYTAKLGPFGNVEYMKRSKDVRLKYTGKQYDTENRMYYFHARYYNPVAPSVNIVGT